ncbi:MAG: LysM peptidoglycan-binding domain-containing protein [Opitutaceae bacterium]|jgi:LysM repeat protein|nr:LysM peptidoglycan-binding domain-containing protein [Opitutaceae bacterium]
MKILKIFGVVVAVHAAVFIFAFVMPGCRSSARTSSTPAPGASQLPPTAGAYGAVNYQAPGSPYDGSGVNTPPPLPASGQVASSSPYLDFGVAPVAPLPGLDSPAPPPSYQPAEVTGVVPLSTYTVVSGDSLWKIARKKGVPEAEIRAANNLNSTSLKVGQTLVIPAKPGALATAGAPGAAPAPATITYTVLAGDSLDRIARRNNTTAAKIRELNKLSSNSITIGQRLTLPAPAPAPADAGGASQPSAQNNDPASTITHVVQGGEKLGGIAKKYGVPQREIAVANRLSDPNRLQAGQRLVIPGVPASPFEQSGTTAPAPLPPAPSPAPVSPVSTGPVSSPVSSSPISSAPLDTPPVNTIETSGAPLSPVTPQGQ